MEKTDESILFPEVEIDGIVVKPWSFGMLFELAESLDRVIKRLEEHPKLMEEIIRHDLTDKGIAQFLADRKAMEKLPVASKAL